MRKPGYFFYNTVLLPRERRDSTLYKLQHKILVELDGLDYVTIREKAYMIRTAMECGKGMDRIKWTFADIICSAYIFYFVKFNNMFTF